jgi:fructose-1,6-bisphosphatase/inositol monophosphatase family enzyme
VRPCAHLGDAVLQATHPDMFQGEDASAFRRLAGAVRLTRWGGDCFSYAQLASGFVDLVVEASLQPYDLMALAPVVEGAGGTISDWQGRPLTVGSDGRAVAAGDPALAKAARALLAGPG